MHLNIRIKITSTVKKMIKGRAYIQMMSKYYPNFPDDSRSKAKNRPNLRSITLKNMMKKKNGKLFPLVSSLHCIVPVYLL